MKTSALVVAGFAAVLVTSTACHAVEATDQQTIAECRDTEVHVDSADRARACSRVLGRRDLSKHEVAEFRCNRAWAYMLSSRLGEAMADFDAAVVAAPDWFLPYNERAFLHLRNGQAKAALSDYNAALKLKPDAVYAHYGRGLALARLGDDVGSSSETSAARRLEPNVGEVFRKLGVSP